MQLNWLAFAKKILTVNGSKNGVINSETLKDLGFKLFNVFIFMVFVFLYLHYLSFSLRHCALLLHCHLSPLLLLLPPSSPHCKSDMTGNIVLVMETQGTLPLSATHTHTAKYTDIHQHKMKCTLVHTFQYCTHWDCTCTGLELTHDELFSFCFSPSLVSLCLSCTSDHYLSLLALVLPWQFAQ